MAEYKGTVELIGGLTPKNNGSFPLVSAKDIQVDDSGKRLDEKLNEIGIGGGSVAVTVDGMNGTSSHGSIQIYELIQAGNTVVAVMDGGVYQYSRAAHFADNGDCDTVEFYRTDVTNEGRVITEYISIYDDLTVDAEYRETTGGANGITPHIGTNGNWYIGDEDTGVSAAGAYVMRLDEMGGDATKTTYRMIFSDGKGYDFDVYNGKDADPYTLTEADKTAIVAAVIESLGGNPIFGYVDEDNNIIVQGNLGDGTYSVKYEMEDGSTVNIGNLVLDTNVYYSVTKNLTNCTINNSATQVVEGGSYSATITANSGYELSSVSVTMGGSAVSVSGGVINIASVTGDIVITAVATEVVVLDPVTESLTLTAKTAITADGSTRADTAGYCATDHIDVSNIPKPCTFSLVGAGWSYVDTANSGYIRFYITDTSGNKLAGGNTHSSKMPDGVTMTCDTPSDNGSSYLNVSVTVTSDTVGTLRFSGHYTAVTPNGLDTSVTKATLTYTPVS